jgi:hypothetical protein
MGRFREVPLFATKSKKGRVGDENRFAGIARDRESKNLPLRH